MDFKVIFLKRQIKRLYNHLPVLKKAHTLSLTLEKTKFIYYYSSTITFLGEEVLLMGVLFGIP